MFCSAVKETVSWDIVLRLSYHCYYCSPCVSNGHFVNVSGALFLLNTESLRRPRAHGRETPFMKVLRCPVIKITVLQCLLIIKGQKVPRNCHCSALSVICRFMLETWKLLYACHKEGRSCVCSNRSVGSEGKLCYNTVLCYHHKDWGMKSDPNNDTARSDQNSDFT